MGILTDKKRLAVFRGGPSEEYQLSMTSGQDVLSYLQNTSYDVVDIIITKGGEWLQNGIVKAPAQILDTLDVVVLATHGAYGEDGTVQRLISRHGTPYIGSGAMASALGFNKMATKERLQSAGVRMPRHMRVSRESATNLSRIASTIYTLFGPQYVIKPVSSGSSLGVMYVEGLKNLINGLETSLLVYEQVLVEEYIAGRDVTCGYLSSFRGKVDYTFPPVQIIAVEKSQVDGVAAEKRVPAEIDVTAKDEVESTTARIHKLLGCDQISRSDFRVTDQGDVYFLEINTIPSLARQSPFMAGVTAVGGTSNDVLEVLITTASCRL